jgi:uncharacterized protein YqcC (DUF446 family)
MSLAQLVRKLDEIEAEMRRIGYWQAEPPAELLAKAAAGEIGYLDPGFSFEQCLQPVFLPAARPRLEDKDLPRESNVGAMRCGNTTITRMSRRPRDCSPSSPSSTSWSRRCRDARAAARRPTQASRRFHLTMQARPCSETGGRHATLWGERLTTQVEKCCGSAGRGWAVLAIDFVSRAAVILVIVRLLPAPACDQLAPTERDHRSADPDASHHPHPHSRYFIPVEYWGAAGLVGAALCRYFLPP